MFHVDCGRWCHDSSWSAFSTSSILFAISFLPCSSVVEFSASTDPAVNEAALSNLREFAAKVRILGEFPSAESTAERALKTKRSYEQLTCGF